MCIQDIHAFFAPIGAHTRAGAEPPRRRTSARWAVLEKLGRNGFSSDRPRDCSPPRISARPARPRILGGAAEGQERDLRAPTEYCDIHTRCHHAAFILLFLLQLTTVSQLPCAPTQVSQQPENLQRQCHPSSSRLPTAPRRLRQRGSRIPW